MVVAAGHEVINQPFVHWNVQGRHGLSDLIGTQHAVFVNVHVAEGVLQFLELGQIFALEHFLELQAPLLHLVAGFTADACSRARTRGHGRRARRGGRDGTGQGFAVAARSRHAPGDCAWAAARLAAVSIVRLVSRARRANRAEKLGAFYPCGAIGIVRRPRRAPFVLRCALKLHHTLRSGGGMLQEGRVARL